MSEIVIIDGVRYRVEDAKRLGLGTGKKAPKFRRPDPTTTAPAGVAGNGGILYAESANDEAPKGDAAADPADQGEADKPARNATKDQWVKYALAQGATAESLEGQTRDQIAETFGK